MTGAPPAEAAPSTEAEAPIAEVAAADEAPAKPKRTRKKAVPAAEAASAEDAPGKEVSGEAAPAKPRRTRKKPSPTAEVPVEATVPAENAAVIEAETSVPATETEAGQEVSEQGPPRRGWWQRTFGE